MIQPRTNSILFITIRVIRKIPVNLRAFSTLQERRGHQSTKSRVRTENVGRSKYRNFVYSERR